MLLRLVSTKNHHASKVSILFHQMLTFAVMSFYPESNIVSCPFTFPMFEDTEAMALQTRPHSTLVQCVVGSV